MKINKNNIIIYRIVVKLLTTVATTEAQKLTTEEIYGSRK